MQTTYLPDDVYEALVSKLMTASRESLFNGEPDSDEIKIALGEIADIWPEAIEPKVLPFPARVPQADCYIAIQHTRRKVAGVHHLMAYAIA
ncbi:hypothetical protein [Rhizobium sp. BK661]|uniref:hypothetical protein n=1 Tax=Rhizobium sp. BK661 TaxID=2586991 RepID=UPI00216A4CE6|nr:hypothetical protein [Rhizobium sp. BK661]MCS3740221.1 hypothetical protein [Rhizobium sp. BK661]